MSNNDSDALSGQKLLNTELIEGQRLADSNAAVARSLAREAREEADDLDDANFKLRMQDNVKNRQIIRLTAENCELVKAVKNRNTVLRNMKAALRESVLREMAGFLVAVDVAKERSQSGTLGTVNSKDDVIVAKEEKRRELEASEKSLATIEKITEERVVEAVGDEEILEEINAADGTGIFLERMKQSREMAGLASELVRKVIKTLDTDYKVSQAIKDDLKRAQKTIDSLELMNYPKCNA